MRKHLLVVHLPSSEPSAGQPTTGLEVKYMQSDRRHSPRYPFISDAQVTEIVSGTELRACVRDLGAGGCFLDMPTPFPVGTTIRVLITHQGAAFDATARVVFAVPNLGMGVAFRDLDTENLVTLAHWLTASTLSC